jgi:hypothetical protein
VTRVYDRLAKEALSQALSAVSRALVAERELAPDAQRLDLWCVPDPARVSSLAPLGLLERIARQGPCAFEFFHSAPSIAEFLGSVRKLLFLRRSSRLPAAPEEPSLWIIAGGRPNQLMKPAALEQEPGWPSGVYGAPSVFRTWLVITSELPQAPETRLLRVLGAGKTLSTVTRELTRSSPDDPVSAILMPLLARLHLEWRDPGTAADPETQEFLMETRDIYETWYRKTLAEGEARGRVEGEARGRVEGEARGRVEGEARGRAEGEAQGELRALLTVLSARGIELSAEHAARVRACKDIAVLEAWLRRAVTATSADQIFD